MEELFKVLNNIHPFSPGLTDHLASILKTKSLKKGDFLLKAGHISRHIHFIQQGLLRCFYIKGSIEVSSWFMKEGDVIVSIESFFHQKDSYESIQAIEDTVVHYISYEELNHLYKTYLEFNFVGRVLLEKYYTLWAQQLYGLRMQQAPERYKWLLENFPELIQRVPAKYLASYLGINQTHFSSIKSKV